MLCCTEDVSIQEISAYKHTFEFEGSKNFSKQEVYRFFFFFLYTSMSFSHFLGGTFRNQYKTT